MKIHTLVIVFLCTLNYVLQILFSRSELARQVRQRSWGLCTLFAQRASAAELTAAEAAELTAVESEEKDSGLPS